MRSEPVYLEVGARRTFAAAVDWPGWCRGARSPDEAMVALLACAPRYASALAAAGLAFVPPPQPDALRVTERLEGGSGTDFGVPSGMPSADARPLDAATLDRHVVILEAAWSTFDAVAAAAVGRLLRLGPRGGGRDLEGIIEHVREAEAAYLHQLGARVPRPVPESGAAGWGHLRERVVATLGARVVGDPVAEPNRVKRPWPPRYHVRRAAWHLLDHAWEIEDRLLP